MFFFAKFRKKLTLWFIMAMNNVKVNVNIINNNDYCLIGMKTLKYMSVFYTEFLDMSDCII